MSNIDQKEYLKKYLGIGKKSKSKKKKSKKTIGTGMKIIDDDFDVILNQEIQEDLDTEDAPQIVSVIDDRPPSLRIDEATNTRKWKPIGEVSIDSENQSSVKLESAITLNKEQNIKASIKSYTKSKHSDNFSSQKRRNLETCPSPPQRNGNTRNDYSPPRNRQKSLTEDHSPKRGNCSSNSRRSGDRDISPPRIRKNISPRGEQSRTSDISPPRKTKDSQRKDISPLRQKRDMSPIRRDSSPPRKRKDLQSGDISPPRRRKDVSPPRDDISPPRKRKDPQSGDNSPQRQRRDMSPSRRDISPPRNRKDTSKGHRSRRDISPASRDSSRSRYKYEKDLPHYNKDCSSDSSSGTSKIRHRSRSRSRETTRKKSRWTENNDTQHKREKTLDGKIAGLQNASQLSEELNKFKQKEAEIFKNMPAEFSGVGAKTVIRRKINEDPVDPVEEERKQRQQKELEEKYNRWGKGLKQVGDTQKRFEEEQHEMNKPLARYVDDEDLEKYLREQENEEDPMLAYVRKKKGIVVKSKLETPDQPIIPNRFGIHPGSRWDGKDRSNGYEAKWLEAREKRKPILGVSIYDEDMEDEL